MRGTFSCALVADLVRVAILCLAVTPCRGAAGRKEVVEVGAVVFEHGAWRCKDTRWGLMAFSRHHEDLVSVSLDLLGQYSEVEVKLFRALVRPGDTVIDVGANIGGLSLPLARIVEGAGS